jgi:DNA-binding response OmpR family regulator
LGRARVSTGAADRKFSVSFSSSLASLADRDACELLTFALPETRFTCAHTFVAGLELIRRGVFDVYVLDNWLPDGSGVDLCREIRSTDPNSPVIFLSAAAYAKDHEAAMEAGATAYLDKPMGLLQLADTITSLTREAELKSLDAKAAALEVIKEHISEQLSEVDARAGAIADRFVLAYSTLYEPRRS